MGPDDQVPDAEELGAAVEEYLQSQPRHALGPDAPGPDAPDPDAPDPGEGTGDGPDRIA